MHMLHPAKQPKVVIQATTKGSSADANGKFVPFNIQPSQQPSVTPNLGEPNKPAPEQIKMPSIVKIDNFSAPGQQNKQEVDRYALGQSDFNASNERATLAQDSNLTVQNIKKNLSAILHCISFCFNDYWKDFLHTIC